MICPKRIAKRGATFTLCVLVALVGVPSLLLLLTLADARAQSIDSPVQEISPGPYAHPIFLAQIAGDQAPRVHDGPVRNVASEEKKEEKPQEAPAGAYG